MGKIVCSWCFKKLPGVVKNLNVKVFNLVLGINEARHIDWHETCTCKCRFNSSVSNNKQRCNDDKCRCEYKELIDKDAGVWFIWNLSHYECECYKPCDFSEYLDYKYCKCKNRLANKLVAECTENIEETRLVDITQAKNENKHKCSSCTLFIVLFSIFFTIKVGIGKYFICYYWYLKKDVICLKFGTELEQQFNELINERSQTNRDQKSKLLFLQRHSQSRKFWIKLDKNWQKTLQRHWYLLYWIHYN